MGMKLGMVVCTWQLGHRNCKVEVSLCYIANARPSKAVYLNHLKPSKERAGSWLVWLNTCNKSVSLDPHQLHGKLGAAAHACEPRAGEAEIPGTSVLSQPRQN